MNSNGGAGSVAAAQLAAEDCGGQINGKPIVILHAHDQSKADVGIGIARQGYDRKGVLAIAQASGAKMLAINTLGGTVATVKQAVEFGLPRQMTMVLTTPGKLTVRPDTSRSGASVMRCPLDPERIANARPTAPRSAAAEAGRLCQPA